MSVSKINLILSLKGLKHPAKLLLIFINDSAGTDGYCLVDIPTVVKEYDIAKTTVNQQLQDLERRILVSKRKEKTGTFYRINFENFRETK